MALDRVRSAATGSSVERKAAASPLGTLPDSTAIRRFRRLRCPTPRDPQTNDRQGTLDANVGGSEVRASPPTTDLRGNEAGLIEVPFATCTWPSRDPKRRIAVQTRPRLTLGPIDGYQAQMDKIAADGGPAPLGDARPSKKVMRERRWPRLPVRTRQRARTLQRRGLQHRGSGQTRLQMTTPEEPTGTAQRSALV